MSRRAASVRLVEFAQIEKRFQLVGIEWEGGWSPAVSRHGSQYRIRVVLSTSTFGDRQTVRHDYINTAGDGTVTAAPYGFARQYKGTRIMGLEAALAKYAAVTAR